MRSSPIEASPRGAPPEARKSRSAAIVRPYVAEEIHWVIRHHGVFQSYYFAHHLGGDRNAETAEDLVQEALLAARYRLADFAIEAARTLEKSREGYNFSWGPRNFDDYTCFVLAQAAHHHGQQEMSETYLARARQAGCRLPFDPSG